MLEMLKRAMVSSDHSVANNLVIGLKHLLLALLVATGAAGAVMILTPSEQYPWQSERSYRVNVLDSAISGMSEGGDVFGDILNPSDFLVKKCTRLQQMASADPKKTAGEVIRSLLVPSDAGFDNFRASWSGTEASLVSDEVRLDFILERWNNSSFFLVVVVRGQRSRDVTSTQNQARSKLYDNYEVDLLKAMNAGITECIFGELSIKDFAVLKAIPDFAVDGELVELIEVNSVGPRYIDGTHSLLGLSLVFICAFFVALVSFGLVENGFRKMKNDHSAKR